MPIKEKFSTSKIDKIGEALKNERIIAEELTQLDEYRRTFQSAYESVVNIVRDVLHQKMTGRPLKTTRSIRDKLCRESIRLSQMQDIAGCRVIVDDIPAQDRLVNALDVFLTRPRIVDRRQDPRHGYRAVHLIAQIDGRYIEVQVRTIPQHLWADISERMADAIDPRIKYGTGNVDALKLLSALSDSVHALEDVERNRAIALSKIFQIRASDRKIIKRKLKILEENYTTRRNRVVEDLKKIYSNLRAGEKL